MAGIVALGGVAAWAFTRPNPPQKLRIKECQHLRYDLDMTPESYMQCVRKCTGIKTPESEGCPLYYNNHTWSVLNPP